MKNKLFALILTLAPAVLHAGTVPLPNSPGATPYQHPAPQPGSTGVKACVHFVGRETEHGLSATAHFVAGTAHVTRIGLKDAVKDTDHAVIKTGDWIAGS